LESRQAVVRFNGKRLDLRKTEDRERLIEATTHRLEVRPPMDPSDGSPLSHERGADDSADAPDESERAALVEMRRLVSHAFTGSGEDCAALVEAAEIAESLELNDRKPVRTRVDILELPFYYYDLMHNPVARGKDVASNIAPPPTDASAAHPGKHRAATVPATSDLGRVDPVPSSFWARPGDVASSDLYEAFGPILRLGNEVCVYEGPKKGYGTTPGFNLACGEKHIKAKFLGPESSRRDTEVAVTRLYHALGYHVEANDYAPEVRVRYDRRILLEFNSRKDLTITVTALGFIPLFRVRIQKPLDPFQYIRGAVTKDGAMLSAEELSHRLIRAEILDRAPRAARKTPRGTHPGHYRQDAVTFEQELDVLVMVEGNVQSRDGQPENVGPWDWNGRDHPERRELRAAGLVAAWTNYFDSRWDNNRLKLVSEHEDGAPHLRHYISDLGGSLGNAENFIKDTQGLMNEFPWSFTEPAVIDDVGHVRQPFRIVGYQPIEDNDAFREMTLDDARWMARLIARISENQIQQALIAAGYTSAEVRLYTEKLVSRRDRMIHDLGLEEEVPLLRRSGVDPVFDYDPRRDGPVVARAGDGSELRPIESRDLVVRAGRVEPR